VTQVSDINFVTSAYGSPPPKRSFECRSPARVALRPVLETHTRHVSYVSCVRHVCKTQDTKTRVLCETCV
jgi:hypothetical protein